jgi:hypothetical protein
MLISVKQIRESSVEDVPYLQIDIYQSPDYFVIDLQRLDQSGKYSHQSS